MSRGAAESGLKKRARPRDMQTTVIRPPLIYGAGALGNFKLLVRAVERGIPLPFASIRNRRAFVSVQNLASFIANRLSGADKQFEVFLVADNEQVSTPHFVRRIAKAAGTKARLVPMPVKALPILLKMSGRPEARESLLGCMEVDVSETIGTDWRPGLRLDDELPLGFSRATGGTRSKVRTD